MSRYGKITSKRHGQNMRKHSWICLQCQTKSRVKVKICSVCESKEIQYFPSDGEAKRYLQLKLFERAGKITNLKIQPEYQITLINGEKPFKYRADFRYIDTGTGKEVVEDVKGTTDERYFDDVFKLKRKAVEMQYGIKIVVVK